MDLEDRAQELEQQHRDDALARAASKVQRGDWRVLSAKWCEGPACGERIPDERRRAMPGVRFCVACKEIEEQKEARLKR